MTFRKLHIWNTPRVSFYLLYEQKLHCKTQSRFRINMTSELLTSKEETFDETKANIYSKSREVENDSYDSVMTTIIHI